MSVIDTRIKIFAGADVSPVVRLRNPKTGDPFNLTGVTKIQFTFKTRNRGTLTIDNTEIPATQAQNTLEEVVFTADTAGANGNDIILQFNGVDTIDTIIGNWNTANPTNTVSITGDGTLVLATASLRLTGGYNAYFPVEVVGDPLLGKVRIALLERETILLKRGPNQSFKVIIDVGQFPGGVRTRGQFDSLDVIDDE